MIPASEVSVFHHPLAEGQAELRALQAESSYCLQQFDNELLVPPINKKWKITYIKNINYKYISINQSIK